MTGLGYALFDTRVGRCGIAWSADGITALQLPEAREEATRARVLMRCPGALESPAPPAVQEAVALIVALLGGEASDLRRIELDMAGVPPFHRRVYEAARRIEPGRTLSYGELARLIGAPGAARAVGQALGRNPFAIIVPCHRVLAAGGRLGGFSAQGGLVTKRRLLALEASASAPLTAPARLGYGFDPDAALCHLRAADARLGALIDRVGPFRLELQHMSSVFGALAQAIVYQQLSGKAAATIHARLCAAFPNALHGPTPAQILRASEEKLRGVGLSRSKIASLQDLARRTRAGALPTLESIGALPDEAIIERLSEVRGIGRWTAEMLLIFRLGRPDVLPVDDYGVRKGYALTFGMGDLPSPKELEAAGERWRPYRTVASWYFWRALDAAG